MVHRKKPTKFFWKCTYIKTTGVLVLLHRHSTQSSYGTVTLILVLHYIYMLLYTHYYILLYITMVIYFIIII